MEESQFTICMFVRNHIQSDNPAGLYLIHPESPTDTSQIDSLGFFLPQDGSGSPIINPLYQTNHLLPSAAMCKLGSTIYFLGGKIRSPIFNLEGIPWNEDVPLEDQLAVRAFNTNDPDAGFFSVAPVNVPKERPCVFASRGKLYALGSNVDLYPYCATRETCTGHFENETHTGHFERYNPKSDTWEILPDPPHPFRNLKHHNVSAFNPVVIHPHVFINDGNGVICFNLDIGKWVSLASLQVPPDWSLQLFPFKPALCDGHLYGIQEQPLDTTTWRYPLRIVRGPAKDGNTLKYPRLVATIEQVDGRNAVYNHPYAQPRKHFYHVGHKVFCYIVDSPLTFIREPYGYHGIWIKFFKEVQVSKGRVEFRLLGSFCYKINQPFQIQAIDFCFLGSLPNEWKKGVPLNQEVLKIHEQEMLQAKMIRKHEAKKKQLQEEVSLLTAQLSHKKQLLKELLSLESKGKQSVRT